MNMPGTSLPCVLLLLGALMSDVTAQSQDTLSLPEQRRAEAQRRVPVAEAAVNSSRAHIEHAMAKMNEFHRHLHEQMNSTLTNAQARKFAQEAHAAHQQERQRLHHSFDTARKTAESASTKLNGQSASMTEGVVNHTEAQLDSQLNLMASNIDSLRNVNRAEQRDARSHLQALQSGFRDQARHLHNDARTATRDMAKASRELERQQSRAGIEEHDYEKTAERNEMSREHLQDRLEEIQDNVHDTIDHIRNAIEMPLEAALAKNDAEVQVMQRQHRATSEMAMSARRLADAAHHNAKNTVKDISLASTPTETWWNPKAPQFAAVVAIFCGTAVAIFNFRQRKQNDTEGAFARMA